MTAAADLGAVRGLHDFWAARTFQPGATPVPPQRARLLLDTLGLGIEQVATYLRDQPDYATFTAWIRATAGTPDGDRVSRYHAWLAGAPPPAATRKLLAEIDTMPPVLDAAQLDEWAADGVIVLRHAITPVEARAAEQVLWQKIDASPDNPASWYGRATQGIMLQCFQHPALEAARRSRRVHKAFAQLFGTADCGPQPIG